MNIDWSNGHTQRITVVAGGETGQIYMSNLEVGGKGALIVAVAVTEVPGYWTGIQWANQIEPVLSGDTGVSDIITVLYDGVVYRGNAQLGYGW